MKMKCDFWNSILIENVRPSMELFNLPQFLVLLYIFINVSNGHKENTFYDYQTILETKKCMWRQMSIQWDDVSEYLNFSIVTVFSLSIEKVCWEWTKPIVILLYRYSPHQDSTESMQISYVIHFVRLAYHSVRKYYNMHM